MIRSEKKLNDLSSIIHKGNNKSIAEAIEKLRDEQPFEGAIELLTTLYNDTGDLTVRKSIEKFMNDLKDQTACKEVINEIRKELKPDTISMLVASCWQSGLDYSAYSADFARTFLKSDYVGAVECLTVIEESADDLTPVNREEIKKIIADNPLSPRNEIVVLITELLSILER
jgi:predicted DNA-binding protein